MKKVLTRLSVLAVGLILVGAGCLNQANQTPSGTNGTSVPLGTQMEIKLATNANLGEFFTDGRGMTLYLFNKDIATTSTCAGQCLDNWPIFYGGNNLILPASLSKADFGETVTPDGQRITTYKGWPLYYYVGDKNPGEVNGENFGGVWFVMKPDYSLQFMTDDSGSYLVDGSGNTLYLFTSDSKDKSACVGQCLVNWPPFYAEKIVIPSIWKESEFGSIKTANGRDISTFRGWPLYYYIGDKARGDKTGQNVGGVWFTINPFTQGIAQ